MKEIQRKKLEINYEDPKWDGLSKKRIKKLARKDQRKNFRKENRVKKEFIPKEKKADDQRHPKVKINKKELRDKKKEEMESAPTVIIDASFGETFDSYSIDTLIKQFQECHSYQMKIDKVLNLKVSSFDQFEKLREQNGESWLINFTEENLLQNDTDLIYLSPDAEETMGEFEKDKKYIIGGLADHNSMKGATLQKSLDQKIRCVKFPIKENVKMKCAPVLSINQSFNILLMLYNGFDWKTTLETCIPKRKRLE